MECVKGLVLTLPVSAAYSNGNGWRRGNKERDEGKLLGGKCTAVVAVVVL